MFGSDPKRAVGHRWRPRPPTIGRCAGRFPNAVGRPRGPTPSATRAAATSGSSAGGRRATRSGRCSSATSRPARCVAVVGAGNGHDVPLRRLAERSLRVDLIDLDARAARGARKRLPDDLRAARRGDPRGRHGGRRGRARDDGRGAATCPACARRRRRALGKGGYDLVIGDLLYSQLLYPALRDTSLPRERIGVVLARIDRPLVASVVRRLHASASPGRRRRARARSARLVGRPPPAGDARRDPRGGGDRRRRGARARRARARAERVRSARDRARAGRRDRRDGVLALAVPGGRRLPRVRDGDAAAAGLRCTSLSGMDALEQYLS